MRTQWKETPEVSASQIVLAQAAEAVGRSRAAISNLLRLFDLPPEVQQMLRDGELSFGHARALLSAPETARAALARRVVARGLTVRQTEALATSAKADGAATPKAASTKSHGSAADRLSKRIGLPVAIRANDYGHGRVTITFRSEQELDDLLKRLD